LELEGITTVSKKGSTWLPFLLFNCVVSEAR